MALPFNLTAEQLFSAAFNKVEIRTAMSPPMMVDLNGPADPATQQLMQLVQPAVILSGPAGSYTVAPYGVPTGISSDIVGSASKIGMGTLLGLGGVILLGAAILR